MLSERTLKEKKRMCPRPWGTLERLPRENLLHIMEMVLNGRVEIAPHGRVGVPRIYPNMAHILTRVNSAWFAWGIRFVWEKVRMRCFTKIFRPKFRVYSNYVTTLYGCDSRLYGGPKEIFGAYDFPNVKAIEGLRLNDREYAYVNMISAKVNDVKKLSIWVDLSGDTQDTQDRIVNYLSLFPDIEFLKIGGDKMGCPPQVLDGSLQLTSLTQLELSIQWHDVEQYRCLSQLSKLTRLHIHCQTCCYMGQNFGGQTIPGQVKRRSTLKDVLEIVKPLENLRCFLFRTLGRCTIEDVETFFEGIIRDKPKLRELSVQLEQFCSFMPHDFGKSLAQYDSALTRLVIYNHEYSPWAEEGFTRIFPKLRLFTVFKPETVFEAEKMIGMDFRSVG